MAEVLLNGKYGYIDKTGRIVIQPQFYEAESFKNGRAKVTIELQEELGTNRKEGYIDKTGKWIEDIN